MIVGKLEELLALMQAQRLLNHPALQSLDLSMVALTLGAVASIMLVADYGYMIYLHFRMVSLTQTSNIQESALDRQKQ